MCAQLRDVFAAENSTVVTKKDHGSRPAGPQRSQANRVAVNVRKRDSCQLAAERVGHPWIFRDGEDGVKGSAF
jgi:hypothetical protein